MPLDISRRATPIFCTFSVALTHSHAQSKDAHPHTHTHTRTHGQTHTSTLSRTFATPNRTELNILPRKAKSVISSIYSTASCFFGLTFSAHSVLPCSLAQQKLKALKMPREWGSGYIDWMRWAGPRGLGYCTELLGRRTFHAGGWGVAIAITLPGRKGGGRKKKKIKTHKKHINHGGTVEPEGFALWFSGSRMLNWSHNSFLDNGLIGLIK